MSNFTALLSSCKALSGKILFAYVLTSGFQAIIFSHGKSQDFSKQKWNGIVWHVYTNISTNYLHNGKWYLLSWWMNMQQDGDKVMGVEMHADTVKGLSASTEVYQSTITLRPLCVSQRITSPYMRCPVYPGWDSKNMILHLSFTDCNQPMQDI